MVLACAPARAADDAALRAACDGPAHATTLVASGAPAGDARAHWIDRARIAWPGMPRDARVRLVVDGHDAAGVGTAPHASRDIALQADEAPVPPALAARFRHVDLAAIWRLPGDADVAALLQADLALVHEDARGRVVATTRLQVPGVIDDVFAAALDSPLGIAPRDGATRFALWAPTARAVHACVYPDGDAPSDRVVALRRDGASGTWQARVAADLRGRYATYLVDVVVPGAGLVRNRVTDPYSVSLSAGSARTFIADLDDPALKPPGWDGHARPGPLASPADMAIYELHVRDFSIGDASVPAAHRGRYAGFTHGASDGMRHLRGLRAAGMTDVHLLPVFDIATVPERGCTSPPLPPSAPDGEAAARAALAGAAADCFNWGYDPFHFNAPEGSYATDAGDGAVRVREFRAMVMALHAAGLRVGMDVVYNHTTTSGQDPRSVLDRIVPGYYHRLDAAGAVTRSTCCENTATEHAMMERLMRDSVALWARDYAIDSFRFDLMGHQPKAAMLAVQRAADAAAGRRIDLLGEGWNFGEVADGARFVQAAQRELAGSGIATFSDRARDAWRGGGCCDSGRALLDARGVLNATGAITADLRNRADLARLGLAGTLARVDARLPDGTVRELGGLEYAGARAGYARDPVDVVNYVENHDNPTLWDINALRLPAGTPAPDRARVQLLGAASTVLSQGIAYFHAGIEVLRSKSLDRNSYDSGDAFNRLDWTYRDNGFGIGLPPTGREDWPLLAPVLRDASARPRARDIAWMRDAFNDLLRIRRDTPLLRLRTGDEVRRRLTLPLQGTDVDARLLVGLLDGTGMPEGPARVLYAINTDTRAHAVPVPGTAGLPFVLHPVLARTRAADDRPRQQARFDMRTGRITVPPRTAVVWVVAR